MVTKDRLAAALWGDNPPRDYDGCLEHYVSLLRRQLRTYSEPGAVMVMTEHRGYRLAAEQVWVDITAFDALERMCAGNNDNRVLIERALSLIGGELLEDEPYAEWALEPRSRYRQHQLRLMRAAAELALGQRDLDGALRWAQSACAIDGFNEASHRLLMLAHYGRGERTEALRVFADLSASLRSEAGVAPTVATATLRAAIAEQVAADDLLPERRATPIEIGALSSEQNAESPPAEIPLLGRRSELSNLTSACVANLAEAAGPGLVVLEGPAGVGKTRLLVEAAARMPGRLVRQVIASSGMRHIQGALINDIVEALADDISDTAPLVAGFGTMGGPNAISLIEVRALAQFLATVEPFVVMVDNAQWADALSIRLLSYLVGRYRGIAGTFVLAIEDEDLRPDLVRVVNRASSRIRLQALSAAELEPLAIENLHQLTGGLPVAVVAHLQAEAGIKSTILTSYRKALFARIQAEGETTWRVAVATAAGAPPCAPAEVAALLRCDALVVAEMQDRLCGMGILRPDTAGFTFRYPIMRELLRAGVSQPRLRLLDALGGTDRPHIDESGRRALAGRSSSGAGRSMRGPASAPRSTYPAATGQAGS